MTQFLVPMETTSSMVKVATINSSEVMGLILQTVAQGRTLVTQKQS